MPAKLSLIVAEMQALVTALEPTVSFHAGERNRSTNGVAPQIVWVPANGSFGAPTKLSHNPKSLWTKTATLTVWIWGRDLEEVERLETLVIQAAHKVAWGSYAVLGTDAEQPDWLTAGESESLTLTFEIPVLARALATVVPTTFITTPGTAGDGVLEPGES